MNKYYHLYRHFSKSGVLLYVGISIDGFRRQKNHLKWKRWRRQIRQITLETFRTRKDALEAERRAIRKESPRFNIRRNDKDFYLPLFVYPKPKKPRRLIDKYEVIGRTGKSYSAIWKYMQMGTFPLSVVDGGKVKWFEHEVDAWLDTLPRSALATDEDGEPA